MCDGDPLVPMVMDVMAPLEHPIAVVAIVTIRSNFTIVAIRIIVTIETIVTIGVIVAIWTIVKLVYHNRFL